MYKELKNKIMTPMFEVDEYIVQLNKEFEATIVNQKERKNAKKMIMEDYMLKLLTEQNYQFLGTYGGGNHHSFHSLISQSGF